MWLARGPLFGLFLPMLFIRLPVLQRLRFPLPACGERVRGNFQGVSA